MTKSDWRALLGLATTVFFIAIAFYVGGYLMFVGGIIQVIQSVTPVIIPTGIGIGVGKVFFAGVVGWVIGLFGSIVAQIIVS